MDLIVHKKTGEEIARDAMDSPMQKQVSNLVEICKKLPQIETPLQHRFTPGIYCREIFMPKGTFVISKVHKTEHPYVITQGKVSVWIEGVGVQKIEAPHHGVTKPGTRRMIYIHEDCRWATFHASNETDVEKLENDLIFDCDKNKDMTITLEEMEALKL